MQRRACKLSLGKVYTTFEDVRNYLMYVFSFEETIFIHKAKKKMYKNMFHLMICIIISVNVVSACACPF